MDHEDAGAQRDVKNEECRPPKQEDLAVLDLLFLRQWFAERGEEPSVVGDPPRQV